MRACWLITCLLLLCACARPWVQPGTSTRTLGATGPTLPREVEGVPGKALALGTSEALLQAMPGVELQRRAYGESHAALVTAQGPRENHPPAVCLRSGGFEVMERAELEHQGSCMVHLLVRKGGRISHFYYAYLNGQGASARGTCGYWTQVAAATWRRLTGQPGTWSTLQVMDPSSARAKAVLTDLIRRTR